MDQEQITDYLANKVFNKELKNGCYIMLKNKQIYYRDDYGPALESGFSEGVGDGDGVGVFLITPHSNRVSA